MEQQKQIVDTLKVIKTRLSVRLDYVSNLVRREERKLEALCQEKGHDFVAERDTDCHASKTLYVCQQCGFVTRIR
jgi:predicted RNA-binding Zn-ribbon protein involved in translation (DUF1610 family)